MRFSKCDLPSIEIKIAGKLQKFQKNGKIPEQLKNSRKFKNSRKIEKNPEK